MRTHMVALCVVHGGWEYFGVQHAFKIQYTSSIPLASGARHFASTVVTTFTGMSRARLSADCELEGQSRFGGATTRAPAVDCGGGAAVGVAFGAAFGIAEAMPTAPQGA